MINEELFSLPFDYEMTEEETLAYQLAIFWSKKVKQFFPEIRIQGNQLSKKGDPRKCSLFRYLIKMIRETRGLIEPEKYNYYIIAQLFIFKKNSDKNSTCYVNPSILTGKNAWKRWKLFEKYLDKLKNRQLVVVNNNQNDNELLFCKQIEFDLNFSKKFLSKFNEIIDYQFLIKNYQNGNIKKWLQFGLIRPYFVALSPTLSKLNIHNLGQLDGLEHTKSHELYKQFFPDDK